jgi:uncharacterized protein involved in outer membrane biogenesis
VRVSCASPAVSLDQPRLIMHVLSPTIPRPRELHRCLRAMPKPIKIILLILLVLSIGVGVGTWLLMRVDTKAQFEAAASAATGLQVKVQGGVVIRLIPALHATLKDVTVHNRAVLLASVREADIGVEFLPLLRQQVRVRQLQLRDVNVAVERDRNGRFNFIPARGQGERAKQWEVPAAAVERLTVERLSFQYQDRQSAQQISGRDCRFAGDDVQLLPGSARQLLRSVALDARVTCAELSNPRLVVSKVELSMMMRSGVIKLRDVLLQALGGRGAGDLDLDFSGPMPSYRINYALEQLRLEQLLDLLGSETRGQGSLDFSASLSLQGSELATMRRTSQGEVSLQGQDLRLAVGNLDEKLARYESSQNFNLVDVGAFFVAGPFGPALTKSYNFASIFRGTRGDTEVRSLMSRWHVENGTARALDVAMATRANRLAVTGSVDFADQQFEQVTVALLDDQGCARVEQKIDGSFAEPQIKRPSVLQALAGPMSRLVGRARDLLGRKCQVFYEGSVAP